MHFNHISDKVSAKVAASAQNEFNRLGIELGCNGTNFHIGTGLGGNNFQLLVLMDMKHRLSSRKIKSVEFQSSNTEMVWGADWLANAPMLLIRKQLDKVFYSLNESYKYRALAMEALAESNNLPMTLSQYKNQFPQLIDCLNNKTYQFNNKLSEVEQLILAYIMCQELAQDLDGAKLSRVQTIGSALTEFPANVILLSVRRYIGLKRLVRHNLDEDPIFSKCLNKVNKLVH